MGARYGEPAHAGLGARGGVAGFRQHPFYLPNIGRSVELGAPLYLGEGVSARRGSVLGEHTVLGANVVVDEDARTSRSIVGPGSFVGAQTDVTDLTIPAGHVVAVDETDFERADIQRGPVVSQLSYVHPEDQLDLQNA